MMPLIKNILVVISGSDSSINAAKYAIMLANSINANLHSLFVVDTSTINELLMFKVFIKEESKEYEKSIEENGYKYLSYIEELSKSKDVKINKILKKGNISTKIIETCDEEKIDIIIMGGLEINNLKKDLIFKTYTDILLDSKKTILIIKDKKVEDIFKNYK